MTPCRYFQHQVAGHDTLFLVDQPSNSAADGAQRGAALIAKPSSPAEIAFYEALQDPEFDALRPWLVRYHGTIPTPVTAHASIEAERAAISFLAAAAASNGRRSDRYDQCLLLANALDDFEAPCVIDIKLGQRLYADDASPAKRESMLLAQANTTSGSMGVRITGLKTLHTSPTHALEEQMATELFGQRALSMYYHTSDDHLYRGYDKRLGRALTADTFAFGLRTWLLPLLLSQEDGSAQAVVQELVTSLEALKAVLRQMVPRKLRLFSTSLLLVYDGKHPKSRRPVIKLIDFARSSTTRKRNNREEEEDEQIREDDAGIVFGCEQLIEALESSIAMSSSIE